MCIRDRVRNVNSRQKLAALSTGESETSGFKQNVHSLQVGADAAVTDKMCIRDSHNW